MARAINSQVSSLGTRSTGDRIDPRLSYATNCYLSLPFPALAVIRIAHGWLGVVITRLSGLSGHDAAVMVSMGCNTIKPQLVQSERN